MLDCLFVQHLYEALTLLIPRLKRGIDYVAVLKKATIGTSAWVTPVCFLFHTTQHVGTLEAGEI